MRYIRYVSKLNSIIPYKKTPPGKRTVTVLKIQCFSVMSHSISGNNHVVPTWSPSHEREDKMARHLKPHKRAIIIHMIRSQRFTSQQIAYAAKCSRRSVSDIHRKLQKFGSARPLVHAGRPTTLTPLVLDTLCDHLIHKPGLYIDEMATFLWKEFNIVPSYSSIQQALSKRG